MSRKLRRHGGDAIASLWAAVDAETEAGLQQLIDLDMVQRLASAQSGRSGVHGGRTNHGDVVGT